MKKFIFQFEDILKIKQNLQEKAEQAYAVVAQQKQSLINENNELTNSFYADQTASLSKLKPGDKISMANFVYENNYAESVKIRIANNNIKIQDLDKKLVKLFDDLKKATIECKKFEKLKEKAFEEYKEENDKEENKELDEISSNKYILEKKKKEYI